MRKRILVVLVLTMLLPVLGGPDVVRAQGERVVLAFYYGWFNSGTWSDSRLLDRPAEPYDSADQGAMARQIAQARSAGFDAFVMSWYGPENPLNTAILSGLMDQAAAAGFHVVADVDLGAEFMASPEAVLNTLRDLVANRIHHPGYFRYQGKAVIFFWNVGRFTPAQWNDIRAQIDPNHDTIWIVEGDSLAYLPVFDGLHLYNIAWSRNPANAAASWAQRTRQAGGLFVGTAMPGWNDTAMGRGEDGFATPRNDGAFFRTSFAGAAATDPAMIVITSWNEYFENTYIEPSQGYGSAYLDLARELIAGYKSGAVLPVGAGAAPAATGVVAIPTVGLLNVRQSPSADGARLTQLTGGERYAVLGRTEDGAWWLVDFGGGQGWISAAYARYEGGDINAMPVTDAAGGAAASGAAPVSGGAATGLIVTAQYNIRLRRTPGSEGEALSTFQWRDEAELLGRNADNSWLLVSYNGLVGWVSAAHVSVGGDVNVAPVVP